MIFISHSWNDKCASYRVIEALSKLGLHCWIDENQLVYGDQQQEVLASAIAQSELFLYLNSISANQSIPVQFELQRALDLEKTERLRVIPVRLPEQDVPLPPTLGTRQWATLDPEAGGVALLAQNIYNLSKQKGHFQKQFTATVRMADRHVEHTLDPARIWSDKVAVRAILLSHSYESLERQYWKLSEVEFPPIDESATSDFVRDTVTGFHRISKRIIAESQRICNRYCSVPDDLYYTKGYGHALWVLLHRLSWNIDYFRHLLGELEFDEDKANSRILKEPFDGLRCEFDANGVYIGSARMPAYMEPVLESGGRPIPWGMVSPFSEVLPGDIGIIIGDLFARKFIAETCDCIRLPNPKSLRFGLP